MNGATAPMDAHEPVLLKEVLGLLEPRQCGTYVDGTFGAGGYSRAILEAADCRVWGIDRDPDAVARGRELARRYGGRLEIVHGRFGDMARLLNARAVESVDGIALDLGVSSMHLDEPRRGFSFRADGPLDMRMEQSGPSAADIVNTAPEPELRDLLRRYGEEPRARQIARAIVEARKRAPFTRTTQLAETVRGAAGRGGRTDPATRTFQALRIRVNDELDELDRGLCAAESLLAPGGTLAVVSFHSLEDRKVKHYMRSKSGGAPRSSRHLPALPGRAALTFRLLTRRAIRPSVAELRGNPRARSARLRAMRRLGSPEPAEVSRPPRAAP